MKTEIRLSVIYFLLGFAWIFVTDLLLVPLFRLPPDVQQLVNTYKGLLYVTLTSLLLYLLLHQEFERRRAAETRMQDSQRLTERILRTVPEAIQIIDLNTHNSTFVNEQAHKLFGGEDNFYDNGAWGNNIHPDDIERFPRFLTQVMDLKDGDVMETEYRIKDNKAVWHVMYERSTVFNRNPDGSVAQVLAVVRDITERRRVEDQIEYQANVLNNVSDAIISIDTNYCITSWNPAAETIYGYTAQEAMGQPLRQILQTQYIGTPREQVIAEVLGLGFWRGEVEQTRKDGSKVYALNATTLLKDSHDGTIGIVIINRDITEKKRFEDEARHNEKLRADLERELNARSLRSRFMTNVSHEFRTPLTTIQLASELLEHYFDRLTEEGRQQRLVQIEVEVKRLLSMLDDILLVLKTESTGEYFNPVHTDLVLLVSEVVTEFQLVSAYPERLSLTASQTPLWIDVDLRILRPAVVNLLSNAMKYSSETTPIEVRLESSAKAVSLAVTDRGIGIPPQDVEHLSEAFYRGANVGNLPGTGLGLLITRQAAEIHGGSLEIKSVLGRGTTVTIHLPLNMLQRTDPVTPA
jgi:PAS domain S-box-containing protein